MSDNEDIEFIQPAVEAIEPSIGEVLRGIGMKYKVKDDTKCGICKKPITEGVLFNFMPPSGFNLIYMDCKIKEKKDD